MPQSSIPDPVGLARIQGGAKTIATQTYCFRSQRGCRCDMFLRPTVRRRHAVVQPVQTTSNLEGQQGILCRTTVGPYSFFETEVRCRLCQGEVPCVLHISEVIS